MSWNWIKINDQWRDFRDLTWDAFSWSTGQMICYLQLYLTIYFYLLFVTISNYISTGEFYIKSCHKDDFRILELQFFHCHFSHHNLLISLIGLTKLMFIINMFLSSGFCLTQLSVLFVLFLQEKVKHYLWRLIDLLDITFSIMTGLMWKYYCWKMKHILR